MKGQANEDATKEELETTGLSGDYKYTENKLRKEENEYIRIKY